MTTHTMRRIKPKSMTMATFINRTQEPKLSRAVIKQVGGWQCFKEIAQDVVDHGADSGWSGFTYYTDTVKFAQDNMRTIKDLAAAQARDMGTHEISMIKGFVCLHGQYNESEIAECLCDLSDNTDILNALAWYTLEETARAYVDNCEED